MAVGQLMLDLASMLCCLELCIREETMRHIILAAIVAAGPAAAYEPLVEKLSFTLTDFQTRGGETVPEMRLGYETYGTLNEARDNAILITHFFSGTSHAAGRYAADDAAPGYWDSIIGSGKPIDTDRYFVVSVDTPVNLNANDPNVITTGPATINSATDEPWGLDFPIMTIGDFVDTQLGLMEQLEIERWHAVIGPSMGGLQAQEWAARYPDRLTRVIPVIASGWADASLIGWLDVWAAPIRLDPDWQGGAYYDSQPPLAGLAQSLSIVTLHANSFAWADDTFGRNWAEEGVDPLHDWNADYAVNRTLASGGAARAAMADANHFLYLVRANQLFVAGHPDEGVEQGLLDIDVPVLMIYSPTDMVFPPEAVQRTAEVIGSDGTAVELVELSGQRGHLDGVVNISEAGEAIRDFLNDD
jgi:homoserine O-acetyltransferase/O-succinyltransferase